MQFSNEVMADVESWCPQVQLGATLVTVNQRLARHFQRRYDAWQVQRGASVWETPNVLSWSAWLLQLHERSLGEALTDYPVINAVMEERLWRNAVNQVTEKNQQTLLDKSAAAKQAQAAWLIQHAWHCYVAEDAQLSLDQHVFGEWSNRFRQLCHQQKVVDASRLANSLRELLPSLAKAELLPEDVMFAGFLTPTTEQQTWWRELPEHGVNVEQLTPVTASAVPQRFALIDEASEWRAAATHARAWMEQNPNSLMGVVVPELQAHRTDVLRAFDAVFYPGENPDDVHRYGRPYDVSLGVPLSEQPVVRCALQMLRFLIDSLSAADVTSVLLSPYFINARSAAEARRRLDKHLRDNRCWEVSAATLVGTERHQKKLDAGFAKALPKAMDALAGKPATLTTWSDKFGRVLQRQLRWPGEGLGSLEYQAVQVWQQVIDELESLDDGQKVEAKVAVQELQRLCQQRLFQPETSNAPIQIMGRLESHGLTFDHLWLSGSDASQWPPKTTATTLLPRSLQKERGVPEATAAQRLHAAKLEWDHWCHAAPHIIASHALTRDGQPLMPAACVADLPIVDTSELLGFEQFPVLINCIAQSAQLQSVADTHGPALLEGVRVKGGARRLEDQAQCPFRGFAIHHLGVKNLEDPGMGLDPRVHGNLLHFALEEFWAQVKTSAALHAMDEASCDAQVLDCINKSLERQNVEPALAELERPRLKRLIDDWLLVEKSRVIGFTVDALEEGDTVQLYGVKIKVLIDRIDVLDSGERIILDYKTGANNRPADWALARIGNPQLPLYATIDESVEGVSFAQVVQNDMGFKGLTAESHWLPRVSGKVRVPESPQDWDEWRNHWNASLELLMTEIREGLATITPEPKACDYCDLKPLCRYRSHNLQNVVDESSDVN